MTNAHLIDQNWHLLCTISFWDPLEYTHACLEFGSRSQLKCNYYKTALNAFFSRTNGSPTLHAVRMHTSFLFLHQTRFFFATHICIHKSREISVFVFFVSCINHFWRHVIILKWSPTNFDV